MIQPATVQKGSALQRLAAMAVVRRTKTPHLLMSAPLLRAKAAEFRTVFDASQVFYAVKANSDPAVLNVIASEGLGFEVATLSELRRVTALGVSPDRMRTSNPIKNPSFIRRMHRTGASSFVIDSSEEVKKVAIAAPGSEVLVRLTVDNSGSAWPLTEKFGVDLDEAVALLSEAADQGLDPAGATFHVGSQCLTPQSWRDALERAADLWDRARKRGLTLRVLNVGGGLPASHQALTSTTPAILSSIREGVRELFDPSVRVEIEPGRALVGDAGALVSTVIGKASRQGVTWLYLDTGVFNGLMEATGGIEYTFVPLESSGRDSIVVVAGPSCDSVDIISKHARMPEPRIGERVLIFPGGSYTVAYASRFNGIPIPRVIVDGEG